MIVYLPTNYTIFVPLFTYIWMVDFYDFHVGKYAYYMDPPCEMEEMIVPLVKTLSIILVG